MRPLALPLAILLLGQPRAANAQQLRRTDAIAQDDLASTGLASDSLCVAPRADSTPGGFEPLPELAPIPGVTSSPIHLAAAATVAGERLRRDRGDRYWRGGGLAQLRVHGATRCRFDGYVRLAAGSGGVGGDALAVVHWPGALGGALHAFVELAAATDSSASDRLGVPRGMELGIAYTTFNLLELLPAFRSPEGRPRLDLRARLSAGALHEYAGDARRLHGKSIVPEYGATTALVVHEMVNASLLYTVRTIPGWLAPASNGSSRGRAFWEQSVVLDHAVLTGGGSALARREPFVGARYGWRRLGALDVRHELALHAGIHLD